MLTPMIMSMQATNLAHQSAANLFGSNQGIMGLANSVTGSESPAQLVGIQQMEKALQFQGIMAQTNLQAAWAMQESAQKLQQKNNEMKRRLMDNGAIFV